MSLRMTTSIDSNIMHNVQMETNQEVYVLAEVSVQVEV